MPLALFGASLLGLFSKESALCIVPLVPLAALLTAQITHPERPLRWARAGVAALTVGAAFVFYVEAAGACFPVATPHDLTVRGERRQACSPARLRGARCAGTRSRCCRTTR